MYTDWEKAFERCPAQFFLEIRQDSCKKIACQRPKFLAAGGTSPMIKQALGWMSTSLSKSLAEFRRPQARKR